MKLLIDEAWLRRVLQQVGEEPFCPHGFMVGCPCCTPKPKPPEGLRERIRRAQRYERS